jgi:hypothetical protein
MKTVLNAALLLNLIITGSPLLGQQFPAVSEKEPAYRNVKASE